MTQMQLDEQVAAATGESLEEIRHLGFSWADPPAVGFDPEPAGRPPHTVDWDRLQRDRSVALFG